MTKQIKAIPTEYDGTEFRSKSEAIFARGIHERGLQYVYEPVWCKNELDDEWLPDFSIVLHSSQALSVFGMEPAYCGWIEWVVEFKPAKVTDLYHSKIDEHFVRLIGTHEPRMVRMCSIFTYDFFNNTKPAMTRTFLPWQFDEPTNGWPPDLMCTPEWHMALSEAKNYRYDLEAA